MAGSKSRVKGHSYERQVAKLFREQLGFPDCVSSRSESKRLDDMKVDLCFTGRLYVQCKAVESLGPIHNVLSEMPKDPNKLNIVFHKRSRQGTVVSMSEASFVEIVKLLNSKNLI